MRILLPPLTENSLGLDAAVQVLDEPDLTRPARERNFDVAVDVLGRKLARGRSPRRRAMRMDVDVVVAQGFAQSRTRMARSVFQ
jgi:hypothetical protein